MEAKTKAYFKYLLVFMLGLMVGCLTFGEIYLYFQERMEPHNQLTLRACLDQSEYDEVDRLVKQGAPVAVVDYQYDRIRRIFEFYHFQDMNGEKSDLPMLGKTYSRQMFLFHGRWSRYLRSVGMDQGADEHMKTALQFAHQADTTVTIERANQILDELDKSATENPKADQYKFECPMVPSGHLEKIPPKSFAPDLK